MLDWSDPPFAKWFVGGKLNVSYNCLDRHVEAGNGDRVAFHWRGEEGEERDITYAELHADVQRFANALKDLGIGEGDVVGIFLPMIPEVAVAMLACTRIGAVHNVVFGGFSADVGPGADGVLGGQGARHGRRRAAQGQDGADQVGGRRGDGRPARDDRRRPPHRGGRARCRRAATTGSTSCIEAADAECPAEPLDAEHPLFILYTSGSTAKPKGILHTTGGYLTQVACTHKYVFDLKPEEDVFWCSADVGWVTGHSYIVYGPLANGATSVMYEGAPDYPDKDIWWELIERYGVTIFYTAPTAIRACIKWGVEYPERHDLSTLRLLGTVGEPINPKAWLWYHKVIGGERCPIVDTWWQTETGAIMITTMPGVTPTKPGSAGMPLPGIQAEVVDDDNNDAGTEQGLPRPPAPVAVACCGTSSRRRTASSRPTGRSSAVTSTRVGDAARRDDDGYYWIIGRIDDVLNVSGHRMSTAEIESAIVSYSKVAEAAVIGQADEDTGQSVTAFVTLEGDGEGDDELVGDIREHVAKRIGKLARPKRIIWADDLPKTRSGKIMRRLLRDIAEGRELGDVTTLRDPDVMGQLDSKIKERQSDED